MKINIRKNCFDDEEKMFFNRNERNSLIIGKRNHALTMKTKIVRPIDISIELSKNDGTFAICHELFTETLNIELYETATVGTDQ